MWINLESLGWIIYDLKFIRAEISRLMTVLLGLRLVDDARAIWFYLLCRLCTMGCLLVYLNRKSEMVPKLYRDIDSMKMSKKIER